MDGSWRYFRFFEGPLQAFFVICGPDRTIFTAKARGLINAKYRVQNAKVKMRGYKIMAEGHTEILQFAF